MSVFFRIRAKNPPHIPHKSHSILSIIARTLASSSSQTTHNKNKNKKPLSVLFEEVIGSREKAESDNESNSNDELKKGLKELELEVRNLKANAKVQKDSNINENVRLNVEREETKNVKKEETKNVKRLGLYSLFVNERRLKEEKKGMREKNEASVLKELSPEMEMFVSHLYKEGYFKKANFLSDSLKMLDFSRFNDSYARDFVKFAAQQFAKDHQELAKWLSGSDLKKVALFGCPSLSRKNVFSAKQLRHYFEIEEDTVCCKCVLKDSCNFANESWNRQTKDLKLDAVMRIITLYALESVPPQLAVSDEVKASVHRLLKEIINLSRTTTT